MKKLDGVYVVDSLANIEDYAGYTTRFSKVVEFLSRKDLQRLPNGRYELDGQSVYAMIQEAQLKPWGMGRPELHRAYFDVQLPLSGEETIGIGRFDQAMPVDFNVEDDFCLCDTPVEPFTLQPGEFAILHPGSCAHAPCCTLDMPGMIRKIVIKVRQ